MNMNYHNRKVIGLWLDKNHGYLVRNPDKSNKGDFSDVHKVEAQHHNEHGSSEHVHHHKEILETNKFFKELAHKIEDYDCIYITGPGKIQEEFHNYLREQKQFHNKLIELGTADHLTMEQMAAQVRSHFSK